MSPRIRPVKLFPTLLGFLCMQIYASAAPSNETVVLLHGLGRTPSSLARLAHELKHAGYRVINVPYPSRTRSLEAIATEWLPAQLATAQITEAAQVHFVTHSMGGILVRMWLRECGAPRNLGRVVMLAPPNAGSEIVERLGGFAPFRWCTGVNGHRLGTNADALPTTLGSWPRNAGELGVIAGSARLNPFASSWVPAPNDGKVSVASTHLDGERDHVVVPYSHTWLGWRRETIGEVKAFLRDGKFSRKNAPQPAG
jgi:triacylglycerol lipase